MLATLRHRQIAEAYDFGYTDDESLPFYTREFVDGAALESGPPRSKSPKAVFAPFLDLLEALHYLHSHDILHLDIHAGNLIVSSEADRGAVLIDFGLHALSTFTSLSVSPRGWSNLPPEACRGGAVSASTDLYMVGKLLQYRLIGSVHGEIQLPHEIPGWGPRLTLDVERIVAKATREFDDLRFASAKEFREALEDALGSSTVTKHPIRPLDVTIGREEELQRIEDLLRRVAAGESGRCWIQGPYGAGKTPLVGEARLLGQLRGLEIAEAAFFPDRGPAPVLVHALRDARGRGGGRRMTWLRPLEAAHGGTPEERARRAAESYFLEKGRPLVLLIDDFECADRESRLLAEALLAALGETDRTRHRRGLGIIVTSIEPPPDGIGASECCRLRPLKKSAATDLFSQRLKPLEIPARLLASVLEQGRGSPLRLIQLADHVRSESAARGRLPDSEHFARIAVHSGGLALPGWCRDDAVHRTVVEVLAVIRRPATAVEVAVGSSLPARDVRLSLARLHRAEVASRWRQGRSHGYQLAHPDLVVDTLRGVVVAERRRVHRRLARHLVSRGDDSPETLARISRHLLGSGAVVRGARTALDAARALRQAGFPGSAIALLEDATTVVEQPRRRQPLLEELSALLEETGDHARGVEVLEPLLAAGDLLSGDGVRVRRRLGIHYHRSGRPDDALKVFQKAQNLARPGRDLEDLVFIDSELAELQTFQGAYDRAEEACRRGLQRLERLAGPPPFRSRMEVTLRASLGHLNLRRLALDEALEEFRAALRLAGRSGEQRRIRAVILNNLGITQNQLNRFAAARRSFLQAERLLVAAGERRTLIKIHCNLAVLGAKLGDVTEARRHIDAARELVARLPGAQLEFFVEYIGGIVAYLVGDMGEATDRLERALPLGAQLGDSHLVHFGQVYLSEADICCGRYSRAARRLRELARQRGRDEALLARMVASRQWLLEALLGRRRQADLARTRFHGIPRTSIELPETWNDLFAAFASLASTADGEPCDTSLFDRPMRAFRAVGVRFGERFARAGLLLAEVIGGEKIRAEAGAREIALAGPSGNKLLEVLEPVVLARCYIVLGHKDRAGKEIERARGAIVGSSFRELDLHIEVLRAHLSLAGGDVAAARRHLHRSRHVRDLLFQLLSGRTQKGVSRHPRFRSLEELSGRWAALPAVVPPQEDAEDTWEAHGIVGRSEALRESLLRYEGLGLPQTISDVDLSLVRLEAGLPKETAQALVIRSEGGLLHLGGERYPKSEYIPNSDRTARGPLPLLDLSATQEPRWLAEDDTGQAIVGGYVQQGLRHDRSRRRRRGTLVAQSRRPRAPRTGLAHQTGSRPRRQRRRYRQLRHRGRTRG